MEQQILSACLKRSSYEEVKGVLGDSFSEPFSPIAQIVAKLLEDYYTRDGAAPTCSKEVIAQRAATQISNPKHLKAVEEFTRGLDETVSIPNLLHDIRQQRKRKVGDKLAGLLANRAEGNDVQELLRVYQELDRDPADSSESDSSEVYQGLSVKELLDKHFSPGGVIPLGTERLVSACDGGARPGHHILVYGRPELGKTLLSIDIVAPALRSGYGVIHFGNEEPMPDTVIRYLMRLTGWTKQAIREDPASAERVAFSKGYGNIVGISVSPGNFDQFSRCIDRYKPSLVILDQLRNVDVGKVGSRHEQLEASAIRARNMAKQTGTIVISVTQAGDSAEGKAFLGLSDIDNSKTGIPGAIDLGIGIGATEEYKRAGIRGISLSKNKLGGKHETWLQRFNTQTGEVTDLSE